MRNLRRKLLSQNFFHNRKLVSSLVGSSSIGKNDLILEIGPGKGIITRELLLVASHVIAIELDGYWYNHLLSEFQNEQNLTLYKGDFLSHPLPKLPYKVFSNIPFAIEGKIIRRLIETPNPPQDCYLVTMDKLANRLLANQSENMFSTMHKPWFDFSIPHHFNPSDFSPTPSVGSVLFRFTLKSNPLIPLCNRSQYQRFVKQGFSNGQQVRNNLRKTCSIDQIDNALQRLSVSKKSKPSQLNITQWVSLYLELQSILRQERK